MPGDLAPGDLERIAAYLGQGDEQGRLKPSFLSNFQASEGPLVKRDGQLMRIPTIVPAQKPDGRCVFLSDKDECTIHPVAPFGCVQFNVCDGQEKKYQADAKVHSLHNAIMANLDYVSWLSWLKTFRPLAKSVEDRRMALEQSLKKLD